MSPSLRPSFGLALAAASALVSPILAQDPPVPPGGFPIVRVLDQLVTWSDGYRTRLDVYRPAGAPPTTGWPGVTAHHGSGGDRKIRDVVGAGEYLARHGYVVWAYDARGAGVTRALNPGWTAPLTQEQNLLDAAESVATARSIVGAAFLDPARLCVTGVSGGGKKAFHAAAFSGKALPITGAVSTFPTVAAIAPEITALDRLGVTAPGGTLASDHVVHGLPATDPILITLAAGDYASYAASMDDAFERVFHAELMSSDVPIWFMVAAQDVKITNDSALDLFATLTAPRRLFLSTTGHSTVRNVHERQVWNELRRQWFDHYAKGRNNGIDSSPFAEIGVQPSSDAAHADPSTIWEHRQDRSWPPAIAPRRLYLRGNGALTPNTPGAVEAGPTLRHRVAAGYDIFDYVAGGSGLNPNAVITNIPKVSASWDSTPLPETTELAGRVRVDVRADDATGLFQLSAILTHVAPNGGETWIASGTGGARPGTAGRHVLTITPGDVTHVIPEGHFVRLRIVNLADHAPPSGRRIRFVPFFTDTDTRILMEPSDASSIELPLRPYRTNLGPRLSAESIGAGVSARLRLSGGPARAGLPYGVFVGASGAWPGVTLPGLPHIPLNLDAWTQLGIAFQNTALFPNAIGFLDTQGRARPTMVVPPAALPIAGLEFTFTAIIVDGGLVESVSGPATLRILP